MIWRCTRARMGTLNEIQNDWDMLDLLQGIFILDQEYVEKMKQHKEMESKINGNR